jgi:hypothetical protein
VSCLPYAPNCPVGVGVGVSVGVGVGVGVTAAAEVHVQGWEGGEHTTYM